MLDEDVAFVRLRASVDETRARTRQLRAESLLLQQRLQETIVDLRAVQDHVRATVDTVRAHLASLRSEGGVQPSSASADPIRPSLPVLACSDCDLEEMADDMIAAYKTAMAIGDDELRAMLSEALLQIGRHIAADIGPKAAGIMMN